MVSVGYIARLVRGSLIDVLGQNFIRTARANRLDMGGLVCEYGSPYYEDHD